MIRDKKDMSPEVIAQLLRQGWTESEIAREFGVTRQAVNFQVLKYDLPRDQRRVFLEKHFPWKVPVAMGQSAPCRNLRNHGEYVASDNGKGMSDDKLKRLRSFYKQLRDGNLVLEFDPNLPPEPGVSNTGGFAFRKRRKSDGDLLIRVNEYTNLTEEGRLIWRFPEVEP
jgi:hypothetical protein